MKKLLKLLFSFLLLLSLSSCSFMSKKSLAYHIINSESENLYKHGDNYLFQGLADDNYLSFYEYTYRILTVFEDGSMLVIDDKPIYMCSYDGKEVFNDISVSIVPEETPSIDINNQFAPKQYCRDSFVFCLDETLMYKDVIDDVKKISYKKEKTSLINLPDVTTYLNTFKDNQSFLGDEIFWLLNNNGEKGYVANNGLSLDKITNLNNVKAVYTLAKGLEYLDGDGSKNNPYQFKEKEKISHKNDAHRYTGLLNTDVELKDLVKVNKVSLVMTGDALIHDSVYKAFENNGEYDFTPIFTKIQPIIDKYELRYYNQETMLGGKELGLSSYPQFNSPVEIGEAYINAGFNLVSLATNHTLDCMYRFGTKGLENTHAFFRKMLQEKNVISAGSYDSFADHDEIRIGSINGLTYALLSYTYGTNGLKVPEGKEYLYNYFDRESIKRDVERYRDKCDILMIAMHAGVDYAEYEDKFVRDLAKYCADLGVDIYIGCHPHVLEPITMVDDTLVIYSLGNCVSSQTFSVETMTGMLLGVDIIKTETNGEVAITYENLEANLFYTSKPLKFVLTPYSELTEEMLPDHDEWFKHFKKVLTKYTDIVKVQ